ncbi:Similar to Protein YTP1; acc. no. P53584 [Pyronema omphalodes CBS 100304]|uniref:Similar to Protein YTP1 acc. no. P53584 n=1 Tax=Pyronema omphalodes (strain CBS 100304) TaxID=1076935 RepID=U4LQZ7_PYROM|nr:Similar to Protein YTP1; acc. no. P53584 [Pyronema omphalodes CBS 100304]
MLQRAKMALSIRSVLLLAAGCVVSAHEHHMDAIPPGEAITMEPLDRTLWWHIGLMTLCFGILYPIGMVLGIVKSRYHVPLQLATTLVVITAVILGHAHKGRQFAPNIHGYFANILLWKLGLQILFGVYLKLHLSSGIHARVRPYVVKVHSIFGKAMPVLAWAQMLFGGITALGFCRQDHLGQCLAHFIMGSAFIAYGILLTIMLFVGQAWLKRSGKSQEFWDSLVIAGWGCVNTFTEHRWGTEWNHGDIQHTSMGVVWWCAGLLGLWLSRGKNGEPRRNIIPAMVIFITGWAMSGHVQHLPVSTMIHSVFGYTLMFAALARIVEICFVLKDGPTGEIPNSWQHLTPYLLFASGFIFMSATEEQMALIATAGIDHVSYLIILYSLAFLLYLFVQILLHIFVTSGTNAPIRKLDAPLEEGRQRHEAEQRAREAEEFELEGLISDDEGSGDERKP